MLPSEHSHFHGKERNISYLYKECMYAQGSLVHHRRVPGLYSGRGSCHQSRRPSCNGYRSVLLSEYLWLGHGEATRDKSPRHGERRGDGGLLLVHGRGACYLHDRRALRRRGAPRRRDNHTMPELPEVETIRRGLAERLPGQTITGLRVRQAQLRHLVDVPALQAHAVGRTITQVDRRAK